MSHTAAISGGGSSSTPSVPLNPESHPDLTEALCLSSELTSHVRSLDLSRLMYRAAVIDKQQLRASSIVDAWGVSEKSDDPPSGVEKGKGKAKTRTEWAQLEIMGWSRFVQSLERQHAALEQLGARTHTADPRDSPLPPILSSFTLAKIILSAPTPITGVRVTLGNKDRPAGGQMGDLGARMKAVKLQKVKGKKVAGGGQEEVVDVICRGGAEWVKLWTKKESQMLAEFREQDSYATSDWSDSDQESSSSSPSARKPSGSPSTPPLSNSLVTTALSLLSLAQSSSRPPGTSSPTLTIHLTRIPSESSKGFADPRIPQTFDLLRSLGVNLAFGDLADIPLSSVPRLSTSKAELLPSLKVNLDPTALVGICADALHHPVPRDMQEARCRYFRTRRYLHLASGPSPDTGLEESTTPTNGDWSIVNGDWQDGYDDHRQSQHSRELLKEAVDEVRAPLVAELRDTLEQAIKAGKGGGGVEFWTTKGAIQHLREAMSNTRVVGEGMEQQRMRRLIGLEEGDFWEGSRYQGQEGCLAGIRLRVFDDRPQNTPLPAPLCPEGLRSLHLTTAATARLFLEEYSAILADPSLLATEHADIPPFLRPDRLPVPKVAELSVPLPIVSLGAIQRGAEEGMTTLCMGNVVWREMFAQGRWKVRTWTQGNWELERARSAGTGELGESRNGDAYQGGEGREGNDEGNAVIWLMPYRSLGEGKRVRFEKGDYSFPVPK